MTTLASIRSQLDALRQEARSLSDRAGDGALDAAAETRFAAIEADVERLRTAERRQTMLDDLDRRSGGTVILPGGDGTFDRLVEGVGLLDVIRSQLPNVTDAAAGRAREASQEMARRSGRSPNGVLWHMGQTEHRTLTTTTPVAGPGGVLIPTDYRPEAFIDRLRNSTRVRAAGATVLSGLTGNVVIPRRTGSAVSYWVPENAPLTVSDPSFDGLTLTPHHAGCLSEMSRNMVMQASPDVEQLCRADMAAVLGETLDAAAINGPGTNAAPRGILSTAGIGSISLGSSGGSLSYDSVADLVGTVGDANATGGAFLTNTRVVRAASKLKDTSGKPLGSAVVFQGQPVQVSNLVPSNGTKGSGTGLSSLIYGNFSDLLIGIWSELDVLVSPYAAGSFEKGNVMVRAFMTVDVAVRHPQSFAAITDIVA